MKKVFGGANAMSGADWPLLSHRFFLLHVAPCDSLGVGLGLGLGLGTLGGFLPMRCMDSVNEVT